MKRNPRKVQWTKAYRRLHGKLMTQVHFLVQPGSTVEFERKLNRLERYDMTLAENTLRAIKIIDKVKTSRSESHFKKRIKENPRTERDRAQKEVIQDLPLINPLDREDPSLVLPKIPIKTSKPQEENFAMEE